jgi:hypothetical protein
MGKLQQMFTSYKEEHEELTKHVKIDELLHKTQHPSLTAAIAQLHFMANTNADHLYGCSESYQSSNFSDVQLSNGAQSQFN